MQNFIFFRLKYSVKNMDAPVSVLGGVGQAIRLIYRVPQAI